MIGDCENYNKIKKKNEDKDSNNLTPCIFSN